MGRDCFWEASFIEIPDSVVAVGAWPGPKLLSRKRDNRDDIYCPNQTPTLAVVLEPRSLRYLKPDFTFKTTVNFESSRVVNLHFVYQITYQSQNDS